ncbi:hypothetical protein MRX96_027226 [Rhipicephalus microplus]
MEVTVNGRDADPEELESSDWVTKVSKPVAELQKSQQRERDGATRAASTSSGYEKEGRTVPAGFNGDKHDHHNKTFLGARSIMPLPFARAYRLTPWVLSTTYASACDLMCSLLSGSFKAGAPEHGSKFVPSIGSHGVLGSSEVR